MKVSFDPFKRAQALADRGVDFADAGGVMNGVEVTEQDDRFAYPEPRFQT